MCDLSTVLFAKALFIVEFLIRAQKNQQTSSKNKIYTHKFHKLERRCGDRNCDRLNGAKSMCVCVCADFNGKRVKKIRGKDLYMHVGVSLETNLISTEKTNQEPQSNNKERIG